MKTLVSDGSPSWRGYSRVAVVLILFAFFSLTLLTLPACKADDQTSKAVRRASSDQKRVALVIGNGDYKVSPLRNSANDARDISEALRTLGFAVQTKTNVNQREMEEAVNRFAQDIQNGDVALFYFSGHGVQVKGENYLIPLGDTIQSEADVRYKTVNVGLVLGKMEDSRNRANIVILDACRNNPFKGLFRSPSSGLSKMDAPKGTFIAYATSPDSVAADGTGRNSPYTKHLIEALKVKDIPIEQVFKLVAKAVNKETGGQQTPWISSSLLDDFFCNPSPPASAQVAALPAPTSPGPASAQASKYRERAERLIVLLYRADPAAPEECRRMFKDPEAAKWTRSASEEGDAIAQYTLGMMLLSGYEVAKDEREAAKWFRKAAEQGNAMGQTWLGLMYENGRGVVEDQEEAVKWYMKSADQGHPGAQTKLGDCYRLGAGVAKDYEEAMRWYRKAADQEYGPALYALGDMYMCIDWDGVPPDRTEAIKWYKKALDRGYSLAKFKLEKLGVADRPEPQTSESSKSEEPTRFASDEVTERLSRPSVSKLIKAAYAGRPDDVKSLLFRGIPVNPPKRTVPENYDHTPLTGAADQGHIKVVRMLLAWGADVNARTSWGDTALICAASEGHAEIVKMLLDREPSQIDLVNHQGQTALSVAVSKNRTEVVKILLGKGADINVKGSGGTLLQLAQEKGNAELVQILRKYGAK